MVDAIQHAQTGIKTASQNIAKAARNIADPKKQDTVINDIVDISINKTAYKANIATLKAVEETQDELLRLFDKEV